MPATFCNNYRLCGDGIILTIMNWRIESMGRFYDAGEGMVVYFDPATGDTHLLSDFAAHIINQFDQEPIATEELVAKVAPDVDHSDIRELGEMVSGVLEELGRLDIVMPT